MNIGIIGAGSLGTALGARLGECGHVIMFGGGASAKDAAERQRARVGSNAETAAFGDVVILAVPFPAIDAALADAGPLPGRVLWSCVNALKPDYSGLALGFDTSAAEEVARRAPGAGLVAALPRLRTRSLRSSSATTAGLRPVFSYAATTPPPRGSSNGSCATSARTPSTPGRSPPLGWWSRR